MSTPLPSTPPGRFGKWLHHRDSLTYLTRKERIAIFAAWDQTTTLPEWQMTPRNVLVEDSLTMMTPAFDYVNVGHPHTKSDFIIKIKPTTTNQNHQPPHG